MNSKISITVQLICALSAIFILPGCSKPQSRLERWPKNNIVTYRRSYVRKRDVTYSSNPRNQDKINVKSMEVSMKKWLDKIVGGSNNNMKTTSEDKLTPPGNNYNQKTKLQNDSPVNGTNNAKPNSTSLQSIANKTLLSMGINPNEPGKEELKSMSPPNKTLSSSNASASAVDGLSNMTKSKKKPLQGESSNVTEYSAVSNQQSQNATSSNSPNVTESSAVSNQQGQNGTSSNRINAIANNALLQMGIIPSMNKSLDGVNDGVQDNLQDQPTETAELTHGPQYDNKVDSLSFDAHTILQLADKTSMMNGQPQVTMDTTKSVLEYKGKEDDTTDESGSGDERCNQCPQCPECFMSMPVLPVPASTSK